MSDLSTNPGKAVSPRSMGGSGDGGVGIGGVSREGKAGGRASLLGKISRTGNNASSRASDADNNNSRCKKKLKFAAKRRVGCGHTWHCRTTNPSYIYDMLAL